MYPMGSNGAGQAILDATSLGGHLARHADPPHALQSYQDDRLPAPFKAPLFHAYFTNSLVQLIAVGTAAKVIVLTTCG